MINLKTEEFVLDMPTLQSLQQLIQWIGDFVLYLLASLPNQVLDCHQDLYISNIYQYVMFCSEDYVALIAMDLAEHILPLYL